MVDVQQLRPRSRRTVLAVVAAALLALDVARSIHARIGYHRPVEPWRPASYEGMKWPPGSDLAPSASLGERTYVERCAVCHGSAGGGNGPAAPSQNPRPRDFTRGLYKYKSTPAGAPPTDADLVRVVARGLEASAMPYWDDVLSDREIAAVVDYVKSFVPPTAHESAEPIPIPPRVVIDAASLGRGQALYDRACASCHGPDGRGSRAPRSSEQYREPTRDLTAPWTFRGGSTPEQIRLRLTTGMLPGPMPSYADSLTPDQRWDVVNYVLSLARPAPWEPGGALGGPGLQPDLARRGEYLVHAEMCGLCHTQVNRDMVYSGDEYYLAGGMGIPAYPQGVFVSRNLTPDPETGLGRWSTEAIANAVRNGRTPERRLNLWGMPWMYLHSFTPEDAIAIATHLKSMPPRRNRIPLPLHYGFLETVAAKLAYSQGMPPLGDPRVLVYKIGNYGSTEPGGLPRDWPQRALIWAQWLVLAAGALAWVTAAPRGRRARRGFRGWAGSGAIVAGLALLALVTKVLYDTPVLGFVPPETIGGSVGAAVHQPDPASFASPEQANLAARGRYLYTVTSCAFCHGNDGRGGSKISMRSFGTLWARNISSDRDTGIGAWSDAEIARAIRSGVARGGRPLHWQGMIWDHLSNLDEEDVRALAVYLRALPPVRFAIPDPRPPSEGDCEEYTFFLYDTHTPGCGA
jgi:cytochrome c oxidase cbb3-type subunit 2